MEKGLSIVIPIYNTPLELLEECFYHLKNLQFSFPYEFILIDDGSKKEIGLFIKNYVKKDTNFRYFFQENAGVSVARNTGISKANFTNCLFLDPDDYLVQNENSSAFSLSEEIDLYFFPFEKINQEGKRSTEIIFKDNAIPSKENLIKSQLHLDDGIYNGINCFYASTCWGKIYKTQWLKEKIQFDVNLTKREDVLFTMEYYQRVKKIDSFSSLTYIYRAEQVNSLSFQYSNNLWENYKSLFTKINLLLGKEYEQDQFLYSFNLFHEGLVLDLLHPKSEISFEEKVCKMNSFKKLISDTFPEYGVNDLNNLIPHFSYLKQILYYLIQNNKMKLIIFLFFAKNFFERVKLK